MKSMEAGEPYAIDMTTVASGRTLNMSGKVIMPHSLHMKGEGMEMLMTPNGVWMSQGGPMQKMPDGMKDQIQGMIRHGMNLGLESIENEQCLGTADFEGGSFTHFAYSANTTFMGIASSAKVNMYVNAAGKPEWMLVEGEALGTKSQTKQHITFDPAITITDPQ
jgi:hypothetical protein